MSEPSSESTTMPASGASKRGVRLLLLTLLLWTAGHWTVVQVGAPPAPKGVEAPEQEFSEARARAFLERILGPQVPHPAGSAAARAVEQRLVEVLRELGLDVEVRTDELTPVSGAYGRMRNVVARLPGSAAEHAALFVSHYDSVWAGPGVADDLAGVAAMVEVARMLLAGPAPLNDIVFLFTEGEEDGLLGAHAYAAAEGTMDKVRAVVNVEARGSRGDSVLFETGSDCGWLVALYAEHATRPRANSLSYEVYRRMPNDTDFSVFKKQSEKPGVNFAFIDGYSDYHTQNDSLEHLEPASLQHHGENLAAMARGLSTAPLASPPKGDRVYWDLFSRVMLGWPAGWSLFIALTLFFSLVVVWRIGRAGQEEPRFMVLGSARTLPWALCTPWLAGFLLPAGLELLRGTPRPWWDQPLPLRIACWSAAIACLFFAAGRAQRRRGAGITARDQCFAAWMLWAYTGLFLAVFMPGASYLFLVPVGALVIGAALGPKTGVPRLAAFCALIVALPLWAPIQSGIEEAFGVGAGLVHCFFLSWIGLLIAPMWIALDKGALRRLARVSWGTCAAAMLVACIVPAVSERHPARLNIDYVLDAESGSAHWFAGSQSSGALPQALEQLIEFDVEQAWPWAWAAEQELKMRCAAAPIDKLAAPVFEIEEVSPCLQEGGPTLITGTLRSPGRAAITRVRVICAGRAEEDEILMRPLGQEGTFELKKESSFASFFAVPAEGVQVELLVPSGKDCRLQLLDVHRGLPDEGQALADARSRSHVMLARGDTSMVFVSLDLPRVESGAAVGEPQEEQR